MVAFLSESWIALLDEAARRLPAPTESLVVTQIVTGEPAARYHLLLAPSGCRVEPGDVPDPDLEFEVDVPTAVRLARGEENAQRALAEGRLKVRGRMERLVAIGDFLSRLEDIYASVRGSTDYPQAPGAD